MEKHPSGRLMITIVAEIDTDYLHAVGVNGDTAATLVAEKVADIIGHEDFGSTILDSSVVAVYTTQGTTTPIHIRDKE